MRLLFWCVLVWLLSGCDQPSLQSPVVAGGSAVEGETVTARLLDADGHFLSGARVQAVSPDSSGWIAVATSDSTGTIRFEVPRGLGEILLSFADPSYPGRILTFRIVLRPRLDTTLVVARWGALTGRILSPAGWVPVSVAIPGLGLDTVVGTGGDFGFEHLPAGAWPLEMLADSAGMHRRFDLGTVFMPSGGRSVAAEFQVRRNSKLRMGFDDTLGGMGWTTCLDTLTDSVEVQGCDIGFADGAGAWSGRSLRWSHPQRHAGRMRLGLVEDLASGIVVSRSDTLVFMARGTGSLRLRFGHSDAAVPVDLSPTFKRCAIPLAVLLGAGQADGAVKSLVFETSTQAWLVLDEVQLLAANVPGS